MNRLGKTNLDESPSNTRENPSQCLPCIAPNFIDICLAKTCLRNESVFSLKRLCKPTLLKATWCCCDKSLQQSWRLSSLWSNSLNISISINSAGFSFDLRCKKPLWRAISLMRLVSKAESMLVCKTGTLFEIKIFWSKINGAFPLTNSYLSKKIFIFITEKGGNCRKTNRLFNKKINSNKYGKI